MKFISKISHILLLLVAFVLGMKQIHEPDLWWMLRTGEWIIENGKVPSEDMFSFTYAGTPWINVKWLFEVVVYIISQAMGTESISLVQSIVNVILVVLFGKTTQNFLELTYHVKAPKNHPLIITGSLLLLFSLDFRLTGRPEMFSLLFTISFLYLFSRFKLKPDNYIFILIPIQILWVNLHEGYALGIIMLVTFSIGLIVDNYVSCHKDKKSLSKILMVTALTLCGISVNPLGIYMYYHPYFLFTMVNDNIYTTELTSFFDNPNYYFSNKETYIVLVAMLLTLGTVFKTFLNQKLAGFKKVSSGYLILLLAFSYLGITWYRNLVYPILFAMPMAIASLLFYSRSLLKSKNGKYVSVILFSFPVFCYAGIVTGKYYEHFQTHDQFGLSIMQKSNPVGAAEYLLAHDFQDKRGFSDYLSSSYFLWRLAPEFKSFIDLRDMDIFPADHFKEYAKITAFTNEFQKSDSLYNYQYVALLSNLYPKLHLYLYNHPDWTAVYADRVASVYLKNNAENAKITKYFPKGIGEKKDIFHSTVKSPSHSVSRMLNFLAAPFAFDSMKEEEDTNILASVYYRTVYEFDWAEKRAQLAIDNNSSPYHGWCELGEMYLEISQLKKNPNDKQKYINMASVSFANAIKSDKSLARAYEGQASAAMAMGQFSYAIKRFKKALEINPSNAALHVNIATCYAQLNQQNPNNKNQTNWFLHMHQANDLEPNNQSVALNLGVAYCSQNNCQKAREFLSNYKRTPEVSSNLHQQVKKCISKCL